MDEEIETYRGALGAAERWAQGRALMLSKEQGEPVTFGTSVSEKVWKRNPRETRVRVGRRMVPLSEATIDQLQIAALKAFPSSPYQREIRAEIDRRHARGEKPYFPGKNPRETTARYPEYTVKGRRFNSYDEALAYWRVHGGTFMEKLDAYTPAYVVKYAHERNNPRETTARYTRTRVRAPGRFLRGSFRTVDPGRPGHTKLVVGRVKRGRTVARGPRKGRPALAVQAVLRERRPGRIVQRRRNPVMAVLGNPPVKLARTLGEVEKIEYTHGYDRKRYEHTFRPRAKIGMTDTGAIVIWHPQHKLWDLFEVP